MRISKKSSNIIQNLVLIFCISFYILIMIYALFLKSQPIERLFSENRTITRSICYVPFDSIRTFITNLNGGFKIHAVNNLLGNVLLFVPFGVYLELFHKKKNFIFSILVVFLTSLTVEIIQYIAGVGISDIDDIILNTFGGVIGIFIYRIILLFSKDKHKAKKIITFFSAAVFLAAIFFVVIIMKLYRSFS